jgi:hypothetical protein
MVNTLTWLVLWSLIAAHAAEVALPVRSAIDVRSMRSRAPSGRYARAALLACGPREQAASPRWAGQAFQRCGRAATGRGRTVRVGRARF